MKSKKRIVLTETEYCHVINKRNGKIKTISGPARVSLWSPFKKIYKDKQTKVIVEEGRYVYIVNPFDKEKKEIQYGDREIRFGPTSFVLHHGEQGTHPHTIPILSQEESIVLKAIKSFDDDGTPRVAGELWIIMGPTEYKPHKYVDVIQTRKEMSLPEHSGIYVMNIKSGQIRLEKGPQAIALNAEERLWKKDYTKSEIEAINFKGGFDRQLAHPLWVLENEVTKIMSEKKQEIVFGPKVILLEPTERPYIMSIAGGTPKNTKRLKIWKIKLGPNFSTDVIDVRTKDNATIEIKLRYQWKFVVDNDEEKIFSTSDFVGLMTEMMASIIRDEAAKYDFEELHSKSSEVIKKAIFGENDYYQFDNSLRVFGIDIKQIVTKDKEIGTKMNDAIKSNMNIYVNKLKQKAQIEMKKLEIEGKIEEETQKSDLLTIEHENYRKQELIKSQVRAEQIELEAGADAKAIDIKSEAKAEAIRKEAKVIEEVDEKYLKLRQITELGNIKKMLIVPNDSKLFIPFKELLEE